MSAYNGSQVNICGGTVSDYLFAYDSSHITVSSGTVLCSLNSYDNSTVNISGGTIGALGALNQGRINVSGGVFVLEEGVLGVGGGGIITFVGSDFALDGRSLNYGKYDLFNFHYPTGYGTLTGTLANGDYLNNLTVINDTYSYIVLEPVPEPVTLLLLGLGAVIVAKRRK